MESSDQIITSGEAAKVLGVHINTIRRWTETGSLPCYRVGPKGWRMIKISDIEKLVQQQ